MAIRRARRVAAGVCLAIPVLALLWVPWYPHSAPSWGGMRFFFWYQLVWVPGSVVFMAAAYALRRERAHRADPERDERHL
ncbi:DUF3311 domain-containing protein [Sphaerisporangium perillae]|uniref:DUF3311 domain-containing protein n=1 Tax=Sphaerisporangium perillae TaxID=2935860 RepID=UPI00200FC9F1|nr:DUF3311 domain-containing protein [Sphaerisporangium perillae]